MKRVKQWIIFSFIAIVLATPLTVFANSEPTRDFYSYIEIREDGSIKVSELIRLNGEYNGLNRDIEYKNNYAKIFTGQKEDLEGSDIYNGSAITDIKVGSIPNGDISFDKMKDVTNFFSKVSYAYNNNSHVYTSYAKDNGVSLKIYNPSSKNETFYIEYVIHDAVVIHNDIAELAWNILGDGYKENIGNLKIKAVLKTEDPDVRVYLKGPLNGQVDRISNGLEANYDFLGAYNAVSIRLLFDKSQVPNATKFSNMNAKDDIIDLETKAANIANKKRAEIRMQNNLVITLSIIWFIASVTLTIIASKKSKKSKKTDFTMEYYRDFPADYSPGVLQYLLEKRVDEKSLSATILNLVYKKVLIVEEIKEEKKKKKDYKLILNEENKEYITETEECALKLLIETIGNGKEVILSRIKKYCSNVSHAQDFINKYNRFTSKCTTAGKSEKFYDKKPSIAIAAILVSALGILVSIVNFAMETDSLIGYLAGLIGVILAIIVCIKRYFTQKGATHYAKWMAHKRFLKDFSRFNEKELPEVILWEKYLVYATVLGCADELSKQMQIKVNTMQDNQTFAMGYDPFLSHHLLHSTIYSSINRSVRSAVTSSRSSIAASRNSSGGGFGGGASFGGGSFGGGGGGGRF